MPLDIVTIPCLSDNYAYLIKGPGGVSLVDAPEAAPIIAELDARGWALDTLLITHHHHDHVGGVAELRDRFGCTVIGPKAETAKLPPLDRAVSGGDHWGAGEEAITVIDVPGHTLGHIAYHFPNDGAVFTADSLMALGCGRVFEGTMDMMWNSLCRLKSLPSDTMIYSGHEYTQSNARFAVSIHPSNPALLARSQRIEEQRAAGQPTVPVSLAEELETNPFLRADQPDMQADVNMIGAEPAKVFAEIRQRKDKF